VTERLPRARVTVHAGHRRQLIAQRTVGAHWPSPANAASHPTSPLASFGCVLALGRCRVRGRDRSSCRCPPFLTQCSAAQRGPFCFRLAGEVTHGYDWMASTAPPVAADAPKAQRQFTKARTPRRHTAWRRHRAALRGAACDGCAGLSREAARGAGAGHALSDLRRRGPGTPGVPKDSTRTPTRQCTHRRL
jgi:hypothetical protein